jgi:hypothetical protein
MKEDDGKDGRVGAKFIEPMLCLAADKLPEGPAWQYEIKLDGYRAIGVRTKTDVELWSRKKRDFSRRFPNVVRALEALPVETVLDGEVVVVNGELLPVFQRAPEFPRRHRGDSLLRFRCAGARWRGLAQQAAGDASREASSARCARGCQLLTRTTSCHGRWPRKGGSARFPSN